MVAVSRVGNAVLYQKKNDEEGRWWSIGRILESIGKYAIDSTVNISTKASKNRIQRHNVVQEVSNIAAIDLRPIYKEKLDTVAREGDMQAKAEKMQEETSIVKHKNAIYSENLDLVLSEKFPPAELKEKGILMPNKKRIMIRSRL